MTIRFHLFVLALCAILPVLLIAIVLSTQLAERDRETVRQSSIDRARAMIIAVDAQLRGSVTTVEAIAVLRSLDRDDLAAFHADAVRVLASQPTWHTLRLDSPGGKQLLNAAVPYGTPLPAVPNAAIAERVLATRRPVIGGVVFAPVVQASGVPVSVPVLRNGTVAYVVTALVRAESFQKLIEQQMLPEGWVSGIVDAEGEFVARIPPRPVGSPASVAFRAAISNSPEGWYRGMTVDGLDTYTAHISSKLSNWSIGLALPAAYVQLGERRTFWITGVGLPAAVIIAFLLAALIGRRIADPLAALAFSALEVGSPAATQKRPERVTEIAVLAKALDDARAAVQERQQMIEREADALRAADFAKNEFIAMLSHELRNPLAALTAAAHLLRIGAGNKAAEEQARGVIERQTRHMTRLIEDLLDINRVTMGKLTLARERFDLAELVTTVVAVWRVADRAAHRTLTVEASPVWVEADRARIEQVLSNLLDNALKFSPAGKAVAVQVREERGDGVLRVSDEGQGLAPQEMAVAFELFAQGRQGLDRDKGGLGVGLALVKGLVELHGGTVDAHSAGVGCGAAFTVRLPAVEALSGPPAAPAVSPPLTRRLRVLLIEDNDDSRQVLGMALGFSGHEVAEAASGAAGVAMAASQRPDVALVDIGLPDINGYEVARRIRAADPDRHTLLIALTGYGQAEDQRRARDAGFDLHLTKPVFPDQLEETIVALDAGKHRHDRHVEEGGR